ncbi:methyltransferase domain-containing protein [Chloroflexota bacterium]
MRKRLVLITTNLAHALLRLVAWLKRNRRINYHLNPCKVNLGSGLVVTHDWINIDNIFSAFCHKWPSTILKLVYNCSGVTREYTSQEFITLLKCHSFVHHNLKYGIPFANESIDYIYTSHFVEHLYRDEAKMFMTETYRALKKGGMIRVGIPDLQYAFSLYKRGRTEEALNLFYVNSKSEDNNYHRYMYDFNSLQNLMRYAGFRNIEKCSYKDGKTPDIDKLDVKPGETLFIEALK